MVFDVIIGRSKKDVGKYGKEGTVLVGKQYVKMGQTTSLSNPVYLDVASAHVVFIVGKRGCLTGNTKVFTNSGYKDIDQFDPKRDLIYSYDGDKFGWESAQLVQYNVNGEDLIEIENYDGQRLVLTNEHPLLVLEKNKKVWKEAKDLKKNDLLISALELPEVNESKKRNKESLRIARLLGFVLADGTMQMRKGRFKDGRGRMYNGTKRRLRIINQSEDVLRVSKRDLEKEFGVKVNVHKKGKENCYIVQSVHRKPVEKLHSLGVPLGLKSHLIRVPEIVFKSSNSFKKHFLRALFSCDGYVNKNGLHIAYYSKSRKFLEDLNLILYHFGIQSTIRDKIVKLNGKIFHNYQLYITDHTSLENFKKIGFVDKTKEKKINLHSFWRCKRRKKTIYLRNSVFSNKIQTIKEIKGIKKVYDLHVPFHHSFIANGVISHNSGKSYTMGSIAEGLADLPTEIKENLSIVLLDTMGIYWTMKYPNFQDAELVKQWNFEPRGLDVKIYTPAGFYYKYKEEGIPTDFPFSLRPLDVGPHDWCAAFNINPNSAEGVLITKVVQELGKGETYSMDDLIARVQEDDESDKVVKSVIVNQFEKAKGWEIFSEEGTPLKDIVAPGQVTVLDVSPYATLASGWEIKALVVGLISRTLFNQRMLARKTEEFKTVDAAMHYFSKETEEKMEEPLVWLAIDECLPYSSFIRTSRGEMKIGKIIDQFKPNKTKVWGYDSKKKQFDYFPITKVYKKGVKEIIELQTETGRKIRCTPDHKILTKTGFEEAQKAENIGTPLLWNYLLDKKLIIARLIGHLYGDGWLSANPKQAGFSGKKYPEDLEIIRKDLKTLGFSSSKIYSRKTTSNIKHVNGKEAIVNGTSHSIGASAKVFNFFSKLGVPVGSKTNNPFLIPGWLMRASKQEKAEFLAALFGADGVAPSQSNKWGGDFNSIRFSFNKEESLRKNGEKYAEQIKKLLLDLGIRVSQTKERRGNIRKNTTKSIKFVITLAKSVSNTIRFLEIVGYKYCTEKEIKGNKWLSYLKSRQSLLEERQKVREKALKLRKTRKWGKIRIAKELGVKDWQVREWIYYNKKVSLPWSFPNFDKWIRPRIKDNILYEKIPSKTKRKPELVYDLSVDKVHNFVADGFVVHNCHELLPKEGKTAATDALITILREGRQPGISLILASQQPGKIHTDVMTQSDTVIAHRLTAKMDTEALGMLMQSYMRQGLDEEINMLPRVKGAAVLFDDANERLFPVQMRPRFTWHGGSAPIAIKEKKDYLRKLREL